jgi:hypothetical protein
LKSALDSFSEDEKKLAELYKNAIQNAETEFKASNERLESQYNSDRKKVYSDTAREERNMFNMLARRGLGFSGEAAQTKLNSDIILANRLGDLLREKNYNALKLEQDLADRKNAISLENAEKQGDLFGKQNDLRTQIAKLELDKEQKEAELKAENDRFYSQLAAEKERFEKELAAKYSSDSGGSGNDSQNKNGYIPEISEKELAKILITNAANGENYKNTKTQFYLVSRYLIDLQDNYNLDSDYYKNLVLILKSYGYTQFNDLTTRAKVVSYEAENYYDKQFDKFYDKYVTNGTRESDARSNARASALRATLDYIASKSRSETEFRRFCQEADIDDGSINDYLKSGVKFK